MKNQKIIDTINAAPARSAWAKGVKQYALELVEGAEVELTQESAKVVLLNGAADWQQYSEGGCALIYNCEIAERLCSPSELKRNDSGRLPPNGGEDWIDCQARALRQAFGKIISAIRKA